MAINRRAKGAKNEKEATKVVAKWTKKKFTRAPTNNFIHQRNEDNSKGDIICNSEGHYFPFCMELKSYAKIDFSHLLNPKIKLPLILEFWQQVKEDATRCNKIPVLMMRYNGMPKAFWFLVIEQELAKAYHERFISGNIVTLRYHDYETNTALMIFRSTDFFKMPYREVRKFTKNLLKNAKR